jgi:hypothetical protein
MIGEVLLMNEGTGCPTCLGGSNRIERETRYRLTD